MRGFGDLVAGNVLSQDRELLELSLLCRASERERLVELGIEPLARALGLGTPPDAVHDRSCDAVHARFNLAPAYTIPMSLTNFQDLAQFAARPFPVGYPVEDHIVLYSPDDRLHAALATLIDSATESVVMSMYGFDDDALATAILRKLQDEHVYVLLVLDSTQAAGKHEKALLVAANFPTNTVVIGRSEKNAIVHLKTGVIDGLDVFGGSTNWSESGESKQDNELTFTRHPLVAARARTKIDLIAEGIRTRQAALHQA